MRGSDDGELGLRDQLTRPGLLVGYALLGAVFAVVLAGWAITQVGSAREMVRAPTCTQSATCLVPRTLEDLVGHGRRRSFGSEWQERTADYPDPQAWVDVSYAGSRHLRADLRSGAVTGLFWHGHLVAFEGADGERVESDDYGSRAWVIPMTLAVGAGAGAGLVVLVARAKRRRAGGWWRMTRSDRQLEQTPTAFLVTVAFFWVCGTLLALDLGASVARAEVINLAIGGGVAGFIVLERKRHPNAGHGRHSADPVGE